MTGTTNQLRALYVTKFANSFGFVTLLTLLPTYVDILDPSGLVLGMFTTGLTLTRGVAVVPVAWIGDRFDKRLALLGGLGLAAGVYGAFVFVETSWGFALVRGLQGLAFSATGLLSLALVSELARDAERANKIGTSNAWRFAAAIGGSLSAGLLFDASGFGAVFGVLVVVTGVAFLAVWLWVDPDETTVEGFRFAGFALILSDTSP